MKKKKILFVNKSFELGGIQSSLNNLLNIISTFEGVDVDVFVFDDHGLYKEQLPSNIKIIKSSFLVRTMGMTFKQTLKTKNPFLILYKLLSSTWSKVFGNVVPIWFAFLFQKKLLGYDYAFAYHQEVSTNTTISGFSRFILCKTDAKVKASWIHTDVKETHLDSNHHRKIYSKLDKIVAISNGVRNHFIESFPEFKSKTIVVHNFHQFDKIIKLSQCDTVCYDNSVFNFITVARLSYEKGQMRMVDIFGRLKREGYKFHWHLIGGADNSVEEAFKTAINKAGLQDNVTMHYQQKNPYRFFVNADALLVPSYNEAAPMVFSEAECLGVPIIATETSSTKEFVTDKRIGLVCENSDEALYLTVKEILDDMSCIISCKAHMDFESSKADFIHEFDKLIDSQDGDNNFSRNQA